MRALPYVGGSAVLGAAYFLYLSLEPFPPDVARAVPIAWLATSAYGAWLAVRDVRRPAGRVVSALTLALSVPNVLFAAVFAMAAVMGG